MPLEEIIEDTGIESGKRKRTFRSRLWAFAGRNWSWLLAVGIVFLFMVIVSVIMSVAPFGKNSFSCIDSIHQYVPFFSDYQRKVTGFESLFYSWNIGMGQNFLSLLLYYIASPLNLILLVVPRSGILSAFTFLVIFKLCFSAGAFGYWNGQYINSGIEIPKQVQHDKQCHSELISESISELSFSEFLICFSRLYTHTQLYP